MASQAKHKYILLKLFCRIQSWLCGRGWWWWYDSKLLRFDGQRRKSFDSSFHLFVVLSKPQIVDSSVFSSAAAGTADACSRNGLAQEQQSAPAFCLDCCIWKVLHLRCVVCSLRGCVCCHPFDCLANWVTGWLCGCIWVSTNACIIRLLFCCFVLSIHNAVEHRKWPWSCHNCQCGIVIIIAVSYAMTVGIVIVTVTIRYCWCAALHCL